MKVVGVCGSPRGSGSTALLVDRVLEGARSAGAGTVHHNIEAEGVGGCMACMACRKTGVCARADGMQAIYADLRSADAVVLGSPVYMFGVSGQTKIFVDRLFALMKPDFSSRLKDMPLVTVFTQGADGPAIFGSSFDSLERCLGMLGLETVKRIVAPGATPETVSSDGRLIEEALETGRDLAARVSGGGC